MLKDRLEEYYLAKDNNCAETMLHAINDEYNLNLCPESFKMVGSYGGGFGCGITCGALVASMAAIGVLTINERAHENPEFKDLCADYVKQFREKLSDIDCEPLKEQNFVEGRRCIKTVEAAAEVFDSFIREYNLTSK